MVRELGTFKGVLQFLSLDAVLGVHTVEETFNQKLNKNYEVLGVLYKEILCFIGIVCKLKLAHKRGY